jgi:hypothetical protein
VIVHLVHGILTGGSDQHPERLPTYLAGFEVKYVDYGDIGALATKFVNPIIVRCLLPYLEPLDIFIGHSNGCAIGYDLMLQGAGFAGAVFINAALEATIYRPANVGWIDVYFNAGDVATEAAEVGARLGLTDPVWGEMGHSGYAGPDAQITNIDCGNTAGLPVVCGHSDIFSDDKLPAWGPAIAQRIRDHSTAV